MTKQIICTRGELSVQKTRAQRLYREADQTAFVRRLESRLDPSRRSFYPSNIKPPSDYSFAHGVLSGYVTGLSREAK